jgi:hypothetical protein
VGKRRPGNRTNVFLKKKKKGTARRPLSLVSNSCQTEISSFFEIFFVAKIEKVVIFFRLESNKLAFPIIEYQHLFYLSFFVFFSVSLL